MLLIGALCALLAIGVWLYCVVDILVTSRSGCRGLPKAAWLVVVALTFIIGAAAWLLLGRPAGRPAGRRRRPQLLAWPRRRPEPDPRAALARSRHPAGRARPIGPDDDPAFLLRLDRAIRGGRDAGPEA